MNPFAPLPMSPFPQSVFPSAVLAAWLAVGAAAWSAEHLASEKSSKAISTSARL